MKQILAAFMAAAVFLPAVGRAQTTQTEQPHGFSLSKAASAAAWKEGVRLAAAPLSPSLQQQPQHRNWIKRHPVATGALVGFGGGFVVGMVAIDEDPYRNSFETLQDDYAPLAASIVGAIGAGIGALVGLAFH
jgi:hypothetical protein